MASMTFSNPGIGKLFQGLAGALTGVDPSTLIQADMMKNRNAGQLIENNINTAKLGALNRQEAAMADLAVKLGDPSLTATPEGRASLMSVLSQVPDGLQHGPGFATGAASFTDPNFVQSDADFSRILSGTGVQGWAQTPEGQSRDLANNIDVANINAASDLAVANAKGAGGAGGKPLTVTPAVAGKLEAMLVDALTAKYGADPTNRMDPGFQQDLNNYTAQIFQQNRNAPLAIQQAMTDANLKVDDPWGFWNEKVVGDPLTLAVRAADTTGLGDVPAGPVAAPSTVPGAVPAAPGTSPFTPAAPAAIPPGTVVPGPRTQWNSDGTASYLLPDGTPQVLVDGETKLQSPSTGTTIIWRGGKWETM